MSFFKTLLGIGGAIAAPFTGGASLIPTIAGAAGSALGAAAQGSAQNRGAEASAALSQEQLQQAADKTFFEQMLAREAEGRAARNDAMRGLQQSEYLSQWKPSATSFSPYTRQLQGPSDAVRQGASSMRDDLLRRLAGGNAIPMPERRQVASPIRKAGMFERFAGLASPALSFLGTMDKPKAKGNI